MNTANRITLTHFVFVLILAVPPILLSYTSNQNLIIPRFWLVFSYISGLTLIVVYSTALMHAINPDNFAQAYLAATVFKILGILTFIVIFVLKNRVNKPIFVADFAYIYFLNTAFEVYSMLCNLRNQNLK